MQKIMLKNIKSDSLFRPNCTFSTIKTQCSKLPNPWLAASVPAAALVAIIATENVQNMKPVQNYIGGQSYLGSYYLHYRLPKYF